MLGDCFLWFPGPDGGDPLVKGETTDEFFGRIKAIQLKSFQFTMKNSVDPTEDNNSAPQAKSRKAKFQEFEIEKQVDAASAALAKACSDGTPFPTMMVGVRKASGSGLLYLQYMFRKVFITGITWSGGGGESTASEKATFAFVAMGFQYIRQTSTGQGKDGVTDGRGRSAWSFNASTGTDSLVVEKVQPPDYLSPYTDINKRRE